MAGAAAGPSTSRSPQPMDTDGGPEDRVVAAYDVHVCAELPALKTQLVLLQQPLRPRWRPYDLPDATAARFKPRAQRLELDVPVDHSSSNYDGQGAQEHMKVQATTLRSAPVDSGAPQAIGVIRDGRLLLMSLDYSLQLRPHMGHLNIAKEKKQKGGAANGVAGEGDMSEDEAAEAAAAEEAAAGPSNTSTSLSAIEVQVKRRETERQQQARLNSFSYLAQKEDEEKWVQLQLHSDDSNAADLLRQRAERPELERELGPALGRTAYLAGFVPGIGGPPAGGASSSGAFHGNGGNANGAGVSAGVGVRGGDGGRGVVTKGEPASAELLAAMAPALGALFSKHSVCSLANVRAHLARWEGALASTVHQGALLDDQALQEAVTASPAITLVRKVFVRVGGARPEDNGMRGLVIRMLRDQEAIKKGDIMAQANAEAVKGKSEAAYLRVVKDLCVSKGNSWSLKAGADGT